MRRRPLLRRSLLVPLVALGVATTACTSFQPLRAPGVSFGSTIEVQYARPESLAIARRGGPMLVSRLVGKTMATSAESVWVRPWGALASRPRADSAPPQFHLMTHGLTERVGIVQWPQGATVRESRFSGRRTALFVALSGVALVGIAAAFAASIEYDSLGSGY